MHVQDEGVNPYPTSGGTGSSPFLAGFCSVQP